MTAGLAGCAWLNPGDDHYNVAPTLEMGEQLSDGESDTDSFAVTNEGRRIEDRLLSRERRASMLP